MENYGKTKKIRQGLQKKPDFRYGSRLCMGKVLAPHNVRPQTISLIKCAKGCGFQNIYFLPKIVIK